MNDTRRLVLVFKVLLMFMPAIISFGGDVSYHKHARRELASDPVNNARKYTK